MVSDHAVAPARGADTSSPPVSASRALAWFLIKRIAQSIVVIFFVTLIVFGLLHALPGGPARGILGQQATPEQIAAFNHAQGFDRPLPEQYCYYLDRLLHGDLGHSYKLNQSVLRLIAQRLPKTVILALSAIVRALLVAIPLGMCQAVRRNRAGRLRHHRLSFVAVLHAELLPGAAADPAVLAAAAAVPAAGPAGRHAGQVLARAAGLVLPVVTRAASTVAVFSRYMRSLDAGQPGRGLRPHGPGQGPAASARSCSAYAAQLADPGGHDARLLPAGAVRRRPGRRAALQLPGHGPAVLAAPRRRPTIRCCWAWCWSSRWRRWPARCWPTSLQRAADPRVRGSIAASASERGPVAAEVTAAAAAPGPAPAAGVPAFLRNPLAIAGLVVVVGAGPVLLRRAAGVPHRPDPRATSAR